MNTCIFPSLGSRENKLERAKRFLSISVKLAKLAVSFLVALEIAFRKIEGSDHLLESKCPEQTELDETVVFSYVSTGPAKNA